METSKLTTFLVKKLDSSEKKALKEEQEISPLISNVAALYEKLRNSMEYREEEVVLRAAIERILNRKLIFGKPTSIAKVLVHELVWAKYFLESAITDDKTEEIEETIGLYLELEKEINQKQRLNKQKVREWILQLLSSDIEQGLRPSEEKELFCNYIYQIFREKVAITGESQQVRDIQVFIACHRVFARADRAMLRFALIKQMFGEVSKKNIAEIADNFPQIQKDIEEYLNNPYKDKIFGYIKRQIPAFFILEGVFASKRGEVEKLVEDEDQLAVMVEQECARCYELISQKVSTATKRTVIFIFLTKVIFALTLETTFETFLFGEVSWLAIGTNTAFAPILMFITTLFINTPDKENTKKVLKVIRQVLYEYSPNLAKPLLLDKVKIRTKTSLLVIYAILWFLALGLGLWGIDWGLSQLHFNPVSKIVFVFFLAVVSFMSYRINQSARTYTLIQEKQGLRTALFDFFFVPFIQLGKYLTMGVAQINVILFIFDYLIETPFKNMFTFLEQWLFFLRSQRETID